MRVERDRREFQRKGREGFVANRVSLVDDTEAFYMDVSDVGNERHLALLSPRLG